MWPVDDFDLPLLKKCELRPRGRPPTPRLFYVAVVIPIFLLITSNSTAQTTGSATLRGTVKDANGAVVTRGMVTLVNEGTNDERRTTSNDEGGYSFSAINPGSYTIKVEVSGFKTYKQAGVVISPSDTRGLDIQLEVGAANESLTITASGEAIQKETGAKEQTIRASQTDNLSIISRSSLELLRILPGVAAPNQAQLESVAFFGGANLNADYNVNGLRGTNNNVSIDGSRVIDFGSNNGTIFTANPDMVQEVKVQTSNYAPEYGASAVQISAVTKNGTKEFHGEAYDYIRSHYFRANDRSNNYAGLPKPKSDFQYPGGNVGGPVLIPGTGFNKNRDKLFFFVGFEVQHQRIDDGTSFGVAPTLKQRQGDFSELLSIGGQNLNQLPTVNIPGGFPNAGSVARNNNLAPYIDPVGRALINLYPLPNYDDPTRRYNYAINLPQPIDRNQAIARFDYTISEKTRLYVRLAREYEEQDQARGAWGNTSTFEIPSHVKSKNLGRSAAANVSSLISPTITNEVLFSASRLKLDSDYENAGKVSLKALGIESFRGFFGHQSDYAPVAIFSDQNLGNLFTLGGLPFFAHHDSYSITDNLTKVHKTHLIKFGGFVEQGNKQQNASSCAEGCMGLGAGWSPGSTANDYGNLLVGRPAVFIQGTRIPTGHFRFYNYEFYAQDSWKIRPNVTLEYGLRLAWFPNNFERDQLGVLFDPNSYDRSQGPLIDGDHNRPNGFLLASRGEIPKGMTRNASPQWGPRLNFAWDINSKGDAVLRGGAGLFYNRVQGNYQYWTIQQPPNSYGASINAFGGFGLGGGKGLTFSNLREVDPFTLLGSIGIQSLNPDSIHIPLIATMSLSLARRLPFGQVLEAAYVGTQGRHLPNQREINFIPPGRLFDGQVGNADLSAPINRVALDSSAMSRTGTLV
ncbi:MAG TPA: carboxypeptidase regulatory-like domain-containing protein, partial [Blastocatellia bacterium]|nr:carboxypeptidase regulatory-like domain-containing protein [Blastocatellia bacterium]